MACRGTVSGVILMPSTGKVVNIRPGGIDDFRLVLTKDAAWKIGVDQSTRCTGVALKSDDCKFVVLMDLRRDHAESRDTFYRSLKYFFRRLAKGNKFSLIVNEKPVPAKFRNSQEILRELLGRLNEWIDDIPEFSGVKHAAVFPQVWRSLVVDKSKGKKRSNIKSEIAADIVDMYPGLESYYMNYPDSGYDSFEALGILDGYLRYAYDDDGMELICGTIEKTHHALVCFDWVDNERLRSNYLQDVFGDAIWCYKPLLLKYNRRYSFYENVRMASSNHPAVFTIVPRDELQAFQWEFNIDISDEGKSLAAFIFKKRDFPRSAIKVLEHLFDRRKEVLGEK